METGFIIAAVVTVAIVVVLVLGAINKKKPDETQGVIYAYYSEPGAAPSLLLEYSVSIDDIASRKRVTFDVKVVR